MAFAVPIFSEGFGLFFIISYSTEQCFEHNTYATFGMTPQDFGRSVNPIYPLGFSNLPTALLKHSTITLHDMIPIYFFSEMLRSWNRGKLSNYGVVSPWWFFVTRRIASKVWSPTIYGIQRSCFGVNKLQVNSIKHF